METIASIIATLALAFTLYLSSLNRMRAGKTSSITLETQSNVVELTSKVEQLTKAKEDLEKKVSRLENTQSVLRDEHRQTTIELTTALRDLLESRKAIATIEKDYTAALGRLELLISERGNLVTTNENLANALGESTKALEDSRSALSTSRQTIEELTVQKARLEGEITGLEKGYKRIEFIITPSKTDEEKEALTNDQ